MFRLTHCLLYLFLCAIIRQCRGSESAVAENIADSKDVVENFSDDVTVIKKRMGVIGPPTTKQPPAFTDASSQAPDEEQKELLQSSSQVKSNFVKMRGGIRPLPISPYSPHNIFTVASNAIGGTAQKRRFDSMISSEEDLTLKIKALKKAQETNERDQHIKLGKMCDHFPSWVAK